MSTEVEVEQHGAVRWLWLNRPDRLNAVCEELYSALETELLAAAGDSDCRALVLAGRGRAFCAGADLKRHREGRSDAERRNYLWQEQRVCRLLLTHPKPVVCALHGYAIGAGLELALNCDTRLAAETAQVSLPELGIGNFVGGGVTALLPHLIGLAPARRVLLHPARRFEAAEARALGLIDAVHPDDALFDAAATQAAAWADLPDTAFNRARALLTAPFLHHYDRAQAEEWQAMVAATGSADWHSQLE